MKKVYNMPLQERETHISFNAGDDVITIDTFDPNQIRKLDKLVSDCPERYRLIYKDDYLGNPHAVYEVADKKLLSFRKPVQRTYTDEERAMLRERMKSLRESHTR